MLRTTIAILAAGILMGASTGLAVADPAPVKVDGGTLQGVTQGKVDAWLGIPYAAPPVGNLRWRAPQAVKPWRRTLVGDTYGPSCFQPDIEFVSEDCLTLNVFRPAGATGPLPVMVWIHGGAMVRGGASTLSVAGRRGAGRRRRQHQLPARRGSASSLIRHWPPKASLAATTATSTSLPRSNGYRRTSRPSAATRAM